jgi:hypothetical protein
MHIWFPYYWAQETLRFEVWEGGVILKILAKELGSSELISDYGAKRAVL